MKIPFLRASCSRSAGFATFLVLAVCGLGISVRAAEPLSDADSKFMLLYEQVQKGLVQSNLQVAKDAAHALPGNEGADLEKASDLKAARAAFAVLSQHAEKIVAGNPEYHVFNCPMVNKDWVQHSATVANPYLGADMLTCGVEKKN